MFTSDEIEELLDTWNKEGGGEQQTFNFGSRRKPEKKVCECGGEKVYGKYAQHSHWCPKAEEALK